MLRCSRYVKEDTVWSETKTKEKIRLLSDYRHVCILLFSQHKMGIVPVPAQEVSSLAVI